VGTTKFFVSALAFFSLFFPFYISKLFIYMHPNSHLHQYLQQSSLAGAANPLSASLQPGPNNNMNALSQHFPAMNRNAGGNNADPFVYAQMMNNGSQQAMPMSANYVMQQQQQVHQQQQQQVHHQQQQQQQQQEQVQKLQQLDEEKIYGLVLDLLNPSSREQALLDLSKKREQYEDLALVLWYSYGKNERNQRCTFLDNH
jgi:CCR4-NOT transcription complex subunit 9